MKFGNIFSRSHNTPPSNPQPPYIPDDYTSEYRFDFDISPGMKARLMSAINNQISKHILQFSRSVMSPSMFADLPRLNYYINGNLITARGSEEQSVINYSNQIMEPQNHWIQENIGTLSSFLHQGIFADFFIVADPWITLTGQRWPIRLVSLDSRTSEVDFHISSAGIIKVICQSKVRNVVLHGEKYVIADSEKSNFSLQLSFRAFNLGGVCKVGSLGHGVDHCRLHVCGEGLM